MLSTGPMLLPVTRICHTSPQSLNCLILGFCLSVSYLFLFALRLRLHGIIWNGYEMGKNMPCVYTGPGGSGTDQICYLVPNVSTYEGDPIGKRTVPVWNRCRVNRVDPYHSGFDPKRI